MDIGRRIRRHRRARDLSQEELGRRIGVTRPVISYYETGERLPSLKVLEQIADVLGVRMVDLLEEDAPKAQAPTPSLSVEEQSPEERRETFRSIIPQEVRIRVLHEVGYAAEALNALYAPEVERGRKALTEERYEFVGEEFVRLNALYADFVSRQFLDGERDDVDQEELMALNHAWTATYDLQNILQRAYEILTKEGATVTPLFEKAAG